MDRINKMAKAINVTIPDKFEDVLYKDYTLATNVREN